MNGAQSLTLGLLAAACLAGCQLGQKHEEQWISATATAPSENVVWELALYALKEQEFPVGTGADPATMQAVTGWRTSLAPFKGEGYRQRAHLRLETVEPGKYEIFLHVEKETNEELARPMDLAHAKWEAAPDDVVAAQILLSKIEARIGQKLEVGKPRRKPAERFRQ